MPPGQAPEPAGPRQAPPGRANRSPGAPADRPAGGRPGAASRSEAPTRAAGRTPTPPDEAATRRSPTPPDADEDRPESPLRARIRRIGPGRVAFCLVAVVLAAFAGITWTAAQSLDSSLNRASVLPFSLSSVIGGDQNILLLGLDSRTDSQGNPLPRELLSQLHAGASDSGGDTTDTIVLLHIPASGGKPTGFSIPRDSYVDLPNGFGKHKINSAYSYGQNAAKESLTKQGITGADLNNQSAQAGLETTVETVESLTGASISHVASVNLAGFASISQAVGGVPVCLNQAVNDSFSGAKFPAGPQQLAGPQALAFVRQRHGLPAGDLDRVKRQQTFLASMSHTLLSGDTLTDPTKVQGLIDAVRGAVTMDKHWGVLGLAGQLEAVGGGQVSFRTIPIVSAAYDTQEDGEAIQVDPDQVSQFISDAGSGSIPDPAPAGGSGSGSGAGSGAAAAPSSAPASKRSGSSAAAPAAAAPAAPASAVPCVN